MEVDGDVPISTLRVSLRVLNFLNSHLKVNIFNHRNVNKLKASFPATLLYIMDYIGLEASGSRTF